MFRRARDGCVESKLYYLLYKKNSSKEIGAFIYFSSIIFGCVGYKLYGLSQFDI